MACILIVDDNPMILDMLTRRLERKGHQVIAVATGGEGIEAARQQNPDIILMDISLPDMDGLDAARLLKNDEKTRETPIIAHHRPSSPIIALTAHALAGDREQALEAGCDEYDTKPIRLPGLLEKIETLTDQPAS